MNEDYKKIEVTWDADGVSVEDLGLPTIVDVPSDIDDEEISDWLSDEYGFCVESWCYY